MQQSYIHIINLEFEAANQLLELENKQNPENAIISLQYNYIDFLTILIGEDEEYFVSAKNKKSDRIDLIQQGDEKSPYYLYAQAEIHLQWAFARLKFEEYLTASYEIQKAYSLLEENQELFPSFRPNQKGLGLLHTLVGAIPENYQWVTSLLGMDGNVLQGLGKLKSLLEDNEMKMYHQEILFLTAFLQLNMTNDEVACKELLSKIGEGYTYNYLLNFAAARLAHSLGKNELCIKVLENRPSVQGKYPFHYLDYLLGMAYLYKLEYEKSKGFFKRFLANFKGNNYIKSAYHKLAWISFLQQEPEKKIAYFKKVISTGNAFIDEDKVAVKYAESGIKNKYYTHSRLLRTRLLYDGGYYEKALLYLSGVKMIKDYFGFYDEYWYRLARIKSKLDYESVEVIANYQYAYDLGKESTTYYGPMSALQIGLIYEKQNESVKAKIYFEKCLSLSNFDYERGIHQKAKAGLNRVSN